MIMNGPYLEWPKNTSSLFESAVESHTQWDFSHHKKNATPYSKNSLSPVDALGTFSSDGKLYLCSVICLFLIKILFDLPLFHLDFDIYC